MAFLTYLKIHFAPDEPISEIIATTKQIPDVKFFITGNYNRINNKLFN